MRIDKACYLYLKLLHKIEQNINVIQSSKKNDKILLATKENVELSKRARELKEKINNFFNKKGA